MDGALFEVLLHEEEGSTLDFKRDQYRFVKASHEDKAELLKDLLGFANALRRADAYILIGVEDVRGSRGNVVGVSEHLDDHSLQQFVAHNTNRTLHFHYEAFTFEGKKVGIIRTSRGCSEGPSARYRPVSTRNEPKNLASSLLSVKSAGLMASAE
jgi:predicted HTH transcriptional regulator